MKSTLISIIALIFLISCNSENKSGNSLSEIIRDITLENLAGSALELDDDMIRISGLVTHVCQHGGQKMFLTNEDKSVSLLVRVTNSIPEFKTTLEGSIVEVTGILVVSVADNSEKGMGHDHDDDSGVGLTEEECETEAAMKDSENGCCAPNITYHVEAVSFKEVIPA
ncbi:MAG: hypothetical protein WD052_06945 [Bacteroidales bacterium]